MRQSIGRRTRLAVAAALSLGWLNHLCLAATAGSTSADQRLAVLRSTVEAMDRKLDQTLASTQPSVPTRVLSHYARNLLLLSQDNDAKAEDLALRAFAEQEMNPQSPTYGEVPWAVGKRAEREDKNAIEFTCLPLGAVMTRYRDRLSPRFIEEITPHLHAALAAIHRHKVDVGYTNIYLMKISNLLLLGEAIHDQPAFDEGIANLGNWLDWTRHNGITEYNSPTYAQTQINSASTAYNNTSNPKARAMLKAALDYLWADVCASYYPPHQQTAGANSRDYDFVYGNGPLDGELFAVGLRDLPPTPTLFNDSSGPFSDAAEAGHRPGADILALAREPVKEIVSAFGPQPEMDRTLYITPEFAVGSAGRCDGAQGRGVSICLNGDQLPVIAFFIDPFDNPDGSVRLHDNEGHDKPQHLRAFQSIVQRQGTILGLYDITPGLGGTPRSSIGLNVLLPTAVDGGLWLDGKRVDLAGTLDLPARDGSVVIVRHGNAVLAASLFSVEGLSRFTPCFALKNDCAGGKVARLVAYAFQGGPKLLTDKAVHAGLLLTAATIDSDAAFEQFQNKVREANLKVANSDGVWRTSYDGLEAALDRAGHVVARKIDGADVQIAGPARLNGADLGRFLEVNP